MSLILDLIIYENLGVNLYYNDKLKYATDSIANHVTRVVFGLRKAYRYDIMDIETKLQLSHIFVTPVLLYDYILYTMYYNSKLKCAINSIANHVTRAVFGLRKAHRYDIMDIETK